MINFTTVGPAGNHTPGISRTVKKGVSRYATTASSTEKKKTHNHERRHKYDRRKRHASDVVMERRYNPRRRTHIDLSV